MLYLVTKNRHKMEEVMAVMAEFGIKVRQIEDEKHENKEMSLEEVAKYNARLFYDKYKVPIAVDDTGIFFKAYPLFPGSNPKLIFNMIGYKGLLKLLENEEREAEFVTLAAYCDGTNLRTFTGRLKCSADFKVNDRDKDVLPYERILLVGGKPISSMSREEKNKISHRAVAFREMGNWLASKSQF